MDQQKIWDKWWDFRYQVHTGGLFGEPQEGGEVGRYSTTHYSEIWKVLDELELRPGDTFLDVGCGKGRVLVAAQRYGCKVIGVEYNPELVDIARRNLGRNAKVFQNRAETFDYSGITAIYMFAPIGPVLLADVLAKVGSGVRVVYVNGGALHDEAFRGAGFSEYDKLGLGSHQARFWRN